MGLFNEAYPHAKTTTMQKWILQVLNELDEHLRLPTLRFTDISVSFVFRMYTGEIAVPEFAQ